MAERYQRSILPLIFYSVIAACLTWPIASHLSSLVIGRPFEDVFESIWYLHWYKHALFDLHVSPLFQPDIFYPTGWDLRFTILPPFYPLLLSPLTALAGPVAANNFAMLASCVVAAYGAFLAVRTMGGNLWGSLFAGLVFAFYPQRQVFLGGHLNFLLGSMWLPWMLLGIVRAAQAPAQRTRWVILTLGAYALSIAGAWQFVFLGGAVLLAAVACHWLPSIKKEWRTWRKPLLIGVLVWSIIVVPLLWGAWSVRSQMNTAAEFSLENIDNTSVSVERLLVPSALNPLFWELARTTFPLRNGGDAVVTAGIIPMVLGLVALLGRRRDGAYHKVALILVVIGVTLMLGPTLHVWGKPMLLPTSDLLGGMVGKLAQAGGLSPTADGMVAIPLPFLILYRLIPPFRSFHGFGRWGLVSVLGIATLSGLGLTRVTSIRKPRLAAVMGGVACLVLLVEFNTQPLPATTSMTDMHRSVDDWLAVNAKSSVIIEYPLSYTMKGQSLYYTLAHGQRIVHGYSSILPQGYPDILARLKQWPEPPTLDLLSEIGVRYVLVHAFKGDDFENSQLPSLMANPQLKLVEVFPTPIGSVRRIYLFTLQH